MGGDGAATANLSSGEVRVDNVVFDKPGRYVVAVVGVSTPPDFRVEGRAVVKVVDLDNTPSISGTVQKTHLISLLSLLDYAIQIGYCIY